MSGWIQATTQQNTISQSFTKIGHNHKIKCIKNSILLHSGLNPAWHFWLSTRFSCCLKMKSVENILGYIREQFYRFSRGCKPRENLWNCSRKYPKMFETYFIFRQQKSSWNHCQAWSCYYATGCFVAFLGDFFEQLLVLALCWFGSTFSLGHLRV